MVTKFLLRRILTVVSGFALFILVIRYSLSQSNLPDSDAISVSFSRISKHRSLRKGKAPKIHAEGKGGLVIEDPSGPDHILNLRLHGRVTSHGKNEEQDEYFKIPARKVAIAVVDTWIDDLFWCDSYVNIADSVYKRWRDAIDTARDNGVNILWLSTEESSRLYEGHPARQRTMLTQDEWNDVKKFIPSGNVPVIPSVPPVGMQSKDWSRCYNEAKERHKRTGLMKPTSTWRDELKLLHPAFEMSDDDALTSERAEIFAYLKKKGIELVVWAGGATNMCVIYKDYGMATICAYYGFHCAVARRMTTVMTPNSGDSRRYAAAENKMFRYFERHFGPTIDGLDDFLSAAPVDPNPEEPHFPDSFDKTFALSNLKEFSFTKSYTPKGRKLDTNKGQGKGKSNDNNSNNDKSAQAKRVGVSTAKNLDRVVGLGCFAALLLYAVSFWIDGFNSKKPAPGNKDSLA